MKKIYFTLLIAILFLAGNFYIGGLMGVVGITLTLSFYFGLAYTLSYIYKKIKKQEFHFFSYKNIGDFALYFFYRLFVFLSIFFVGFGSFVYYQNEISPAKMPNYILSNGEKTVVFQSMSHIGTPKFYSQVQKLISQYKSQGFVYFFEGVRSGSEENHKKFDEALGIEFNENTYDSLSELYGLVAQDNSLFLGLINDKDFNVDVSIDDIMEQYGEKKTQNSTNNRSYQPAINVDELVGEELKKLSPRQLHLIKYINKSLVNFIIKSESLQNAIQNNFSNQELFEVILDERNKVIAQRVLDGEETNIIMTYGMLHFEGIFEILHKNDPRWKISQISSLYPLK